MNTQQVMSRGAIANPFFDRDIWTVGASFKPIPQVVLKLDYRNFKTESRTQDIGNQVQASVGYVF
jgi:hypothetical protein